MTDYTNVHGSLPGTFNSLYLDGRVHWEEGSPPDILMKRYRGSLKTCSYCGSAHPADIAAAIRAGAVGRWADWKYGWPHKAYFDGVPNPHVGIQESVTACSHPPTQEQLDKGEVWLPPEEGSRMWSQATLAAPTLHIKFYTVHLLDATPEDRDTIERHLGLKFTFVDNDTGVRWAPYPKDE